MRTFHWMHFLSAAVVGTAIFAQTPAPKPDVEVKKLHVLVGHWTWEWEAKPGPLGSGGKATGEYDGQMILGGFFTGPVEGQDRFTGA